MQAKASKVTISGSTTNPEYQAMSRKKAVRVGLGIVAVVAVAVIAWVALELKSREAEFARNLQNRLELISSSQVQLTEDMLKTVISQADRVVNSELFQLYASEIHLMADDVSLLVSGPHPGELTAENRVTPLATQLPLMQSLLAEFTRISGYLGGKIVNRAGTVYIATDASSTPLRADQMDWVNQVLQHREPRFGPLQNTSNGLVLEAFLPIFPPKASGLDPIPVAVLLLTKVVDGRIDGRPTRSLLEKGERIRFVQKVADGYEEVVSWRPGELQRINAPLALDGSNRLPFMVRMSLSGETRAYSLGIPIAGPDWWIIVEADFDRTRAPLREQMKSLMSIAVLLILIFGVKPVTAIGTDIFYAAVTKTVLPSSSPWPPTYLGVLLIVVPLEGRVPARR